MVIRTIIFQTVLYYIHHQETKFKYSADYENAETGMVGGFLGDTGGNLADGMKSAGTKLRQGATINRQL